MKTAFVCVCCLMVCLCVLFDGVFVCVLFDGVFVCVCVVMMELCCFFSFSFSGHVAE